MYVSIIFLIYFLSASFLYSLPINPNNDINEQINLIKSRLNINSMECMYTVTYFLNPKLSNGEEFKKTCHFYFKYSNGNFIVIREKDEEKEKIKGTVYDKTIDKPNNLLEALAMKYNRFSYTTGKLPTEKQKEYSKLYYYFYKNIGTTLFLDFVEGENQPTTISKPADFLDKFDDYARFGDPRYLLGYIGLFLDDKDYPKLPIPLRVTDLLDLPGKTLIRQEGNYKVLLHIVNNPYKEFECTSYTPPVCNLINEYLKWYSFEIWIDSNNDIVKIIEVDYFPILYGKEFVSRLCGYNASDYNPYEIRRIFEFKDFKEFPDGIKFPLKSIIKTYKYWITITNPNFEKDSSLANDYYNENKISPQEYRVLSHCYTSEEDYDYFISMEIHPETLKINHPIPEETFIPPEVNYPPSSTDKNQNIKKQIIEKSLWFERYKPYLFISGGVIITLVTMFITKRYLGWGI